MNVEFLQAPEVPVDCQYGPWSDYGPCSNSCGQGKKRVQRPILAEAKNGGRECSEDLQESIKACHIMPCDRPIHPLTLRPNWD